MLFWVIVVVLPDLIEIPLTIAIGLFALLNVLGYPRLALFVGGCTLLFVLFG